MKKRLGAIIVVSCYIIILTTPCFAKTYMQKDRLFKMDIPKGWIWNQGSDSISIKNQKTKNDIFIKLLFLPMVSYSDAGLKKGMQMIIATEVESVKGSVISEGEIRIDGVYARKLEYVWTNDNKAVHTTIIIFVYEKCLMRIVFSTDSKDERLTMKKIVETLRLLRPTSPVRK